MKLLLRTLARLMNKAQPNHVIKVLVNKDLCQVRHIRAHRQCFHLGHKMLTLYDLFFKRKGLRKLVQNVDGRVPALLFRQAYEQ